MLGSSELDAIIGAVMFIGLIRGGMTGPTEQFVNMLAVAGSFLLAFWLMGPVGNLIAFRSAPSPSEVLVVGYGISFVTLFSIFYAMYHLNRHRHADERKLYVIERVLGGIAGVLFTMALMSVLLMVLEQVGLPAASAQQGATLYRPVADIVYMAWSGIPGILGVGTLAEQFQSTGAAAPVVDAVVIVGLGGAFPLRRR